VGRKFLQKICRREADVIHFRILSKSHPSEYYTVSEMACDCLGFLYKKDCSHLKQVQKYLEDQKKEIGNSTGQGENPGTSKSNSYI
jgi:hypothetical protein